MLNFAMCNYTENNYIENRAVAESGDVCIITWKYRNFQGFEPSLGQSVSIFC